jgi:MFS family permease
MVCAMHPDAAPDPRRVADRRAGVRRLLAMEIVSGIGDGVFWVGLVALLFDRGVGAEGFAAAALVRLGPRALVSIPAGTLADRLDRRALLVGLDIARAATMGAVAAAVALDAANWMVLGIVLLSYTLAAPYRPAISAELPHIAGETNLSRANASISTTRQVMTFVGPVVGAAVVALSGATAAFVVNGVTFLIAALLIAGIHGLGSASTVFDTALRTPRASTDPIHGWRAVLRTPGVAVLTSLVFVMYVVRGAELVLYALVADQLFDLGAAGLGILTGAVGLGAVAAMPTAARVTATGRPDVLIISSLAATAVPIALLAYASTTWAAVALLFVVGGAVVVFEVVSVVLLQRAAPPAVLGRMFGLVGTASNGGRLIGAIAAPAVVGAASLDATFTATAAAVSVVGLASMPALAQLTRGTRAQRTALRPVVEVLSRVAVFDGASRITLERVAAVVEEVDVAAGDPVVRQGDPAEALFVARTGTFDVFVDDDLVNRMAAGDWFGEIGLIQSRPRTATVIASSDARVWRIPGDAFLGALSEAGSAPAALIDTMTHRLSRSGDRGS